MEQLSIFDDLNESFKIKKPIRLIEFFAGIGSQAKAMENLNLDFEHWKIAEWAIPSILAYANIHRDKLKNYGVDYTKFLKTKDVVAKRLFDLGVSTNYNEPAKLDQLKRMGEDKLRLIYNSIQWANNLVDITKVKGKDLEISETDKYCYVMTYSFPCQDLSLAGKRAGMERDSGTRSGMLWQVERILKELNEQGTLPQVLLMENVKEVLTAKGWREWYHFLEKIGYSNFCDVLNAKNYGIPQNRERAFMVSILGQWNYKFPKRIKLELRLKDMLEDNVDEKYYLSEAMVNYISKTGGGGYSNKDSKINLEIARPLTTEQNKRAGTTNYLSSELPEETDLNKVKRLGGLYDKEKETHQAGSIYDKNGLSPTLDCSSNGGNRQPMILIKNATKQGYLEAEEGDGVDISGRMEYHRGTVQKGITQTLTTMGGENNGVVVKENIPNYTEKSLDKIKGNIVKGNISGSLTATGMQSINHDGCQLVELKRGYSCEVKEESEAKEQIDVIGNYSKSNFNQTSIVGKNGIAPTVTENHGQVTAIVENKNE